MKNIIKLSFLLLIANLNCTVKPASQIVEDQHPIEGLKGWLLVEEDDRVPIQNLDFSKKALTKSQSSTAIKLLHADKQNQMVKKYGAQWDSRELIYKDFKMPFYYQIFGEAPADGRSLFISMHGGGGAPSSVNDQQYENQQHLYDSTMINLEGVYLAPRAPTNTWNLWHQSHIDELFNILIQLAVVKENVNPNKVYLLGYSAGGDGVYQLAPRLADRLAAASMMAGHPNDASPLSLRNLPFAIHMGADDEAYNRNKVAKEWGDKLAALQSEDTKGYIHDVQIHPGMGHWMKRKDSVALPWMTNYKRNPIPQKVVWQQSGRHHSNFYWVQTPDSLIQSKAEIRVTYHPELNEIHIEENYAEVIEILVNDEMLDLDKEVTVRYKNEVVKKGIFNRTILNIYETLVDKGDKNLAFLCLISVEDKRK